MRSAHQSEHYYNNHRSPQCIFDMPTSEQSNHTQDRRDKHLISIWNDSIPVSPAPPIEPPVEAQEISPEPTDGNDDLDQSVSKSQPLEAQEISPEPTDGNGDLDQSVSNSQEAEHDVNEFDPANFVKPKANVKKAKKLKRAEEKHRAEEVKKAAEVATGPYIPGMTGSVKSEDQIVATGNINDLKDEEKIRKKQETAQRQREQMEALTKIKENQKARLEREVLIRIQQEKLAMFEPWAKKENSHVKEAGQERTLKEIQRMEAERERNLQEVRVREEEER